MKTTQLMSDSGHGCVWTGPENKVPNMELEWYDFGGGWRVAPTVTVEGERLPGLEGEGNAMAALHCIKNGKYYYKVITGTFTDEDLPSMFKELAPVFAAEVAKAQQ